ncbi:hypothetical protein GBAR_LOCUS16082 [Geodia barretti]|uniref:Uncharacterized protein n=1 Tax=Geodia barretti TaxID=519541 RepID=A0AA35SEI6_GEOBA|nr:hypothetical protein GBAR_LOCUS16082 [Geodia barretti]
MDLDGSAEGHRTAMDDDVFVARVEDGLERVTNRNVELRVNEDEPTYLEVGLDGLAPRVALARDQGRITV